MLVRRVAALLASVVALLVTLVTPALATSGPDYPPTVSGNDTAVEGTKVANDVANNNAGGLPHTGFEAGLVWTAVALVVLGLALVVVTRRRANS